MKRIDEYYQFMVETAFNAGRLTLGYFQAKFQMEFKSDRTPVTDADRKAEEYIRGGIEKEIPTIPSWERNGGVKSYRITLFGGLSIRLMGPSLSCAVCHYLAP